MIDEDPVLRVLCADDNHDTADTLVVFLQIAGLDATAYYDGSSVLAAAESTSSGRAHPRSGHARTQRR